jgi:hypothetical protein
MSWRSIRWLFVIAVSAAPVAAKQQQHDDPGGRDGGIEEGKMTGEVGGHATGAQYNSEGGHSADPGTEGHMVKKRKKHKADAGTVSTDDKK